MTFNRSSGILLHPTSLPGPNGIGELGPAAYRWIDFLADAGCRYWQILPLGPTSYGDSPYQCFSAFAGNPYLVSFERLLEEGLLVPADMQDRPEFDPERVDFGVIYQWKLAVLDKAYERFAAGSFDMLEEKFAAFQEEHEHWLPDFALFMALKDAHGGKPWTDWSAALRGREKRVLTRANKAHAPNVAKHAFRQFLFFQHWIDVRTYAHSKGVQIIGDAPIFVAMDSADVWANPERFYLDDSGQPTVVAGVPPDYFSETGQLWGNPLYRWDLHKENGYSWWLNRLSMVLSTVDIVRLDHFRGFYDYWEIPADAETAVNGEWKKGPAEDFFKAVEDHFGSLPIIAEDLGELSPGVYKLRDKLGLPGMKILVFAFTDDESNLFMPHNHTENNVVYTGTHDNDTVLGWWNRVEEREREFARRYLNTTGDDISWDIIRAAWESVCFFALAPMQDFLALDNRARMNYPGVPSGNWQWRMQEDALTDELKAKIRTLNEKTNRL